MKGLPALFCVAGAIAFPTGAQANTCSTAGVPLLTSMESASPDPGSWFVSTSYQYRDLSDTYRGGDEVDDGVDRDRTTQSLVTEISRGFSERWSASLLFAYVEHERRVGGGDRQQADGWGDAIALVKYAALSPGAGSPHALSLGAGARIPVGKDDARGSRGFLLAEDMQPSTGAWGGIGWLDYSYAFDPAATLRGYSTASYTYNEDNDRNYQFGHEANAELGLAWDPHERWGLVAGLRYRHAERDERNGVEVPNTGGEWLDFVPAVQYRLTPSLAVKAGGTVPLWRDLNDALQFSTRYAVHLSVAYSF